MENINFGPEEYELLKTKAPGVFWEMVSNVLIRENHKLKTEIHDQGPKPDQ